MNDAEWLKLRELWQQERGQLPPDLQRYAQKHARGLWRENLLFWTIVAGECALALRLLVHERNATARLDAWVILGLVLLMSAWFVGKQRRLWPKPLEIPSEMLARFDRHLSRSEVGVWIGAGVFVAGSLFAVIQGVMLRGGLGNLWGSSKILFVQAVVALLTVAILPRWVARRARLGRERIRTWREEIGEAS
jgi:hypothetical protein